MAHASSLYFGRLSTGQKCITIIIIIITIKKNSRYASDKLPFYGNYFRYHLIKSSCSLISSLLHSSKFYSNRFQLHRPVSKPLRVSTPFPYAALTFWAYYFYSPVFNIATRMRYMLLLIICHCCSYSTNCLCDYSQS